MSDGEEALPWRGQAHDQPPEEPDEANKVFAEIGLRLDFNDPFERVTEV